MVARNFYNRTHNVNAYRSGLEQKISDQLETKGVPFRYEEVRIPYTVPETRHFYRPDWILPNGIVIEGKGLWDVADRKKHLLLKEQYPDLDIRFVFSSSRTKLYKGSKTTYADYCIKNGWQFADKLIPLDWLKERPNIASLQTIKQIEEK